MPAWEDPEVTNEIELKKDGARRRRLLNRKEAGKAQAAAKLKAADLRDTPFDPETDSTV